MWGLNCFSSLRLCLERGFESDSLVALLLRTFLGGRAGVAEA
jgi:hypothetical protein